MDTASQGAYASGVSTLHALNFGRRHVWIVLNTSGETEASVVSTLECARQWLTLAMIVAPEEADASGMVMVGIANTVCVGLLTAVAPSEEA